MNNLTIALVLGAAVVGGVVLYRRGKTQSSVGTSRPGLVDTLTTGVKGVIAGVRAATPTNPSAPTIQSSPTYAGGDPLTSQTVPGHSTFRLGKLAYATAPITDADRFGFGIN